jgi:hypothetical protein
MLDHGRPAIGAVVEDRQVACNNCPEVGSLLMNLMNALARLSGKAMVVATKFALSVRQESQLDVLHSC